MKNESQKPGDRCVAVLSINGIPSTRNAAGRKRKAYLAWLETMKKAASSVQPLREPPAGSRYSLRANLRVFAPWGQVSDLDNYLKDILDCMAGAGLFGPPENPASTLKGDERVDHLEIRRTYVSSESDAGLAVELYVIA